MRKGFWSALICWVMTVAAHADVIDDFKLTGPGTVIAFSLPASPVSSPSYGAGGADAGFFPVPEPVFTVNGAPAPGSVEFLSGRIFVGPGVILNTSLGSYTLVGELLYGGTSAKPTFLTGSFNLHNFYGDGTPAYVLTITPEMASTTPEPASLVLVLSGAGAVMARWKLKSRGNAQD